MKFKKMFIPSEGRSNYAKENGVTNINGSNSTYGGGGGGGVDYSSDITQLYENDTNLTLAFTSLDDEVGALVENFDNIDSQINTINQKDATQDQSLNLHSEQIKTLTGNNIERDKKVTALETAVGTVDDVADATGSLYARDKATNARIDHHTDQIKTIVSGNVDKEKRITALETNVGTKEDVSTADTAFGRIKKNSEDIFATNLALTSLDEEVGAFNEHFDNLDSQITSINQKDTAQDTSIALHTEQIKALTGNNVEREKRITALETAVGGTGDTADAAGSLYARDKATNERIDHHTDQIKAIVDRNVQQTKDITNLRTDLGNKTDVSTADSAFGKIKKNSEDILATNLNVTALDEEIGGFVETFDNINGQITAINQKDATQDDSLNLHSEQIKTIVAKNIEQNTAIEGLRSDLGNKTDISTVDSAYGKIQGLTESFISLDTEVGGFVETFDNIDSQIVAINQKNASQDVKLQNLSSDINTINTGNATRDTNISNLQTSVGATGDTASATGSLYARDKATNERIDHHTDQIKTIVSGNVDKEKRITSLETNVGNKTDISTADTAFGRIKKNAEAIANTNLALTSLDDEVGGFVETFNNIDGKITAINQKDATQDESLNLHSEQIKTIVQKNIEQNTAIEGLRGDLGNKTDAGTVDSAYGKIQGLTESFISLDTEVGDFVETFNNIDGQITAINGSINTINQKDIAQDNSLNLHSEQIKTLTNNNIERDKRITSVETAIGATGDTASATGSLYARDKATNARIDHHTEQINTIVDRNVQQTKDITNLRTDMGNKGDASTVDSLFGKVQGLTESFVSLDTEVGGFVENFDNIDTQINTINQKDATQDNSLNLHSEQIKTIVAKNIEQGTDITNLRTDLGNKTDVSTADSAFGRIKKNTEAIANTNLALASLDDEVGAYNEHFNNIDGKITAINQKDATQDESLNLHSEQIKTIVSKNIEQGTAITNLQTNLGEKIDGGSIDTAFGRISALQDNFSALDAEMGNFVENFDNIDNQITAINRVMPEKQYKIRLSRVPRQGSANSPFYGLTSPIECIVENFDEEMRTHLSDYRIVLMLFKKKGRANRQTGEKMNTSRQWRVPMFSNVWNPDDGVKDPNNNETMRFPWNWTFVNVQDVVTPMYGGIIDLGNGSYQQRITLDEILNMKEPDPSISYQGAINQISHTFRNSHNRKFEVGWAIFKKTRETVTRPINPVPSQPPYTEEVEVRIGQKGWTRVSNIARIQLFCTSGNFVLVNVLP